MIGGWRNGQKIITKELKNIKKNKMNRNSEQNTYTPVVKSETKVKVALAKLLHSMGYSKEGIASLMELSLSRINEYLKEC